MVRLRTISRRVSPRVRCRARSRPQPGDRIAGARPIGSADLGVVIVVIGHIIIAIVAGVAVIPAPA
jgi:hypothetical protein